MRSRVNRTDKVLTESSAPSLPGGAFSIGWLLAQLRFTKITKSLSVSFDSHTMLTALIGDDTMSAQYLQLAPAVVR